MSVSIKIVFNFFFATISSVLLTGFIAIGPFESWSWILFLSLLLFFFVLGTFYGDEFFNITGNWPPKLKRIKDYIGNFFGTILLIILFCFVLLMFAGLLFS